VVPTVTAFRLPKNGYTLDECEDAFDYSVDSQRYAIADGATESSFSDRWAQSLVNWAALPWYCQEKAERGAYAAFVGLEFGAHGSIWEKIVGRTLQGEEMVWQAFAVGDSCLFQVRDGSLIASFPIQKSDDFTSRPILLASDETNNLSALKDIQSASGGVKPGDRFFLATDALAKWFLSRLEAGEKPWETLLEQQTEAQFAALVEQLRKTQNLRNDDTTLVIIHFAN
jgi:hypothetical protein